MLYVSQVPTDNYMYSGHQYMGSVQSQAGMHAGHMQLNTGFPGQEHTVSKTKTVVHMYYSLCCIVSEKKAKLIYFET
jgi:hypothetical protein